MAGAESQHCRETSQHCLSRERGLCFTPETVSVNEFPRSLWDQGHRKEEERENRHETLRLCVCGSDAMLAAISRSTSDAGPFPVFTPRAGAGTRGRGHREVPGERIRQPVSHEEEEMSFAGAPHKTHSAVTVTPLAASQMVTKRSSLHVAFSFRCP